MTIQKLILPGKVCREKELFIRTQGLISWDDNILEICPGGRVCTDTYMNLMDAAAWYKYTGIRDWILKISVKGKGIIEFYQWKDDSKNLICQKKIDTVDMLDLEIAFEYEEESKYYFAIQSETAMTVSEAEYVTEQLAKKCIYLALIICTYQRKDALYRNLEEIYSSLYFADNNELDGKLDVICIDNASELAEVDSEHIRIIHNINTGGTGGFSRGMEEIRKGRQYKNITHVILMDDDVEFLAETLYRLYALLSYSKKEYEEEAVAGRMFRMDKRNIQYTAAEIWNKGYIEHIGWNNDMTRSESLRNVNLNSGAEYGGWWFSCYPVKYVVENIPFPFFLHCDDVEYGLRHGGTPIIMNGIQVWHETYEYRKSAVILYYDIRNSMIVNAIHRLEVKKSAYINRWKNIIGEFHAAGDYESEYMGILAMKDFLRGPKWLMKTDSCVLHNKLRKKRRKKLLQIANMFLWRLVKMHAEKDLGARISDYSGILDGGI